MSARRHRNKAMVVVAALVVAASARGHVPDTIPPDTEVPVEKPRRSTALYGDFVTGDEVFTIVLDYEEGGFAQPFEILVPVDPELEEHRPMFAVIGPGLPPPTDEERALLPREVPDGAGVFLERNDLEERPRFYEPFSQTDFWTSEPTAVALDAGVSEVWVFSPEGTTGRFTLGFGVEEDFEAGDIVELLFDAGDY